MTAEQPNSTASGEAITPRHFAPPGKTHTARRPPLTLWRGITLIVLTLALVCAWFVLTARSVGVKVEPANASVDVLAWPTINIGDHWLLRAGQRRVRATAPGYVTFDEAVLVSPAQLQTLEITLQKLPGHLRVRLDPAVPAALHVDGQELGAVPGVVDNIPAGMREIEIRSERYLPHLETLEIEGKDIEQTLDVVLKPAWAEISLNSRPPGAVVTVDRKVLGTTPLSGELLYGRRALSLSLEGYKPWQQTLTVNPGTEVNLGEIVLAKADGIIALSTTPDGATVTVDGEYRGHSPLSLPLTPDSKHRLTLLKEGYKPYEHTLSVNSGQREALALTLQPELATVHLETSPAEAELLIDGEPHGNATQTLTLPTFEHELIVRAPGYATYQGSITPRKGVEKRYRIRLKTQAEMAREAAQKTDGSPDKAGPGPASSMVTTHDGQQMKLFTGGKVELGAAARDPARRDNEVQRTVKLQRPFYLALKEVTNADFHLFLANHTAGAVAGVELDADLLPVVGISWELAASYCNWLSRRDGLPPFYRIRYGDVLGVDPAATGYRLPTEAEWEWAAKVPPDGPALNFPWGAKFPPPPGAGNFADRGAGRVAERTMDSYEDSFVATAPVGSFKANSHGLYDLGGNVAEWVHDFYVAKPSSRPAIDPLGPAAGQAGHVIKGSSWRSSTITELRPSARTGATAGDDTIGFRLARYAQ